MAVYINNVILFEFFKRLRQNLYYVFDLNLNLQIILFDLIFKWSMEIKRECEVRLKLFNS